jgi:hypothetical protein
MYISTDIYDNISELFETPYVTGDMTNSITYPTGGYQGDIHMVAANANASTLHLASKQISPPYRNYYHYTIAFNRVQVGTTSGDLEVGVSFLGGDLAGETYPTFSIDSTFGDMIIFPRDNTLPPYLKWANAPDTPLIEHRKFQGGQIRIVLKIVYGPNGTMEIYENDILCYEGAIPCQSYGLGLNVYTRIRGLDVGSEEHLEGFTLTPHPQTPPFLRLSDWPLLDSLV